MTKFVGFENVVLTASPAFDPTLTFGNTNVANGPIAIDATALTSGHTLTLTGSSAAAVTLNAGQSVCDHVHRHLTVTGGAGANTITVGSGGSTITGGGGANTLPAGPASTHTSTMPPRI